MFAVVNKSVYRHFHNHCVVQQYESVVAVVIVVIVDVLLFDHRSQAEGVTELTPKGFIDWCRNGSGYERKHLYDDKKLNEAVQVW